MNFGIVSAAEFPATTLEGPTVRDEIQFEPPGVHVINASRGGKLVKLRMKVHAGTAAVIARAFQEHTARFQAGQGDQPFFDFNHNDDEASGHPISFWWGGDDPKTGGVRCKVDWTPDARDAIQKRIYTRFSPQFIPDDETGEVIGMPVNMGGLVNRAAFKTIQPVAAKDFGEGYSLLVKASEFEQAGMSPAAAVRRACSDNAAYLDYMRSLGLRGPNESACPTLTISARGVESASGFIASAKAATGKTGLDALTEFSKTPAGIEAYNSYLRSMRGMR